MILWENGFSDTNLNKCRVYIIIQMNCVYSHDTYGTRGLARFLVPRVCNHNGHEEKKILLFVTAIKTAECRKQSFCI